MTAQDHMQERRTLKRTRVVRPAKIIVSCEPSLVHCTVHNINSGGACLQVADTFAVPQTFELTFELGRTRRLCRVVWRSRDRLGVAFEPEPPEPRIAA
jgi:PilZ domain